MDDVDSSGGQFRTDGDAATGGASEQVLNFTFGYYTQKSHWTDRQTLTWSDLVTKLTTHEVGPKKGTCIVPATFRGTKRAKADADRIDVAFLDSDSGATLDEIRTAVVARGWRAIIASSHSHLTTTTTCNRLHWDKFRAQNGDDVPGYLITDKGYLHRVVIGAVLAAENEKEVTFEHQPCPKFRIVIPLLRSWKAADHASQSVANTVWKDRVEALAAALNLRHDQSCVDTSRVFYLPRRPADGPPPEIAVLEGKDCDIFALPVADRSNSAKTRRKTQAHPFDPMHVIDPTTGEVFDLRKWERGYGSRFQVVTALRARRPGVFRGKVLESKHHLCCVNAAAHTSSEDDFATFAINASEAGARRFVLHCMHGHCVQHEHLVFLKQMVEQKWISVADLTDPAFLTDATAGQAGDVELTEHGVAVVFAQRHRDDLRYCHTSGAWYHWQGTHWARNSTRRAFTCARNLVAELNRDTEFRTRAVTGKAAFASAVERYAQADDAFAVTAEIWDTDPFLLGTPGGVVDLRTGVLRSAARTDYVTRVTAVAPIETADCPNWLAFLEQATAGDRALIAFLQRWFGYCLTGVTREHALLFVYGPGGNGKGVLLVTISGILGVYGVTAALDTFTSAKGERHSTDLAMLAGARLVMTTETEEGRAWAEARIKAMTGGDPVTARFMRQDYFTYFPAFKLTISGNHKPALSSVDDAARRRFNVVPFLHRPAAPDPQLTDRLRAEWPGILRWMIDGCLAWQHDGLARPKVVLDATAEYFADQDVLSQWIEECCEVGAGFGETSSSLFGSWRTFAQGRSENPHNAKWLGAMLERQGYRRAKDCAQFRGRGYLGIRLLPEPAAKPWNEPDA